MAKKSSIENNMRRAKLVKKFAGRRARLKEIANNESLSMEERFASGRAGASRDILALDARGGALCSHGFSPPPSAQP